MPTGPVVFGPFFPFSLSIWSSMKFLSCSVYPLVDPSASYASFGPACAADYEYLYFNLSLIMSRFAADVLPGEAATKYGFVPFLDYTLIASAKP